MRKVLVTIIIIVLINLFCLNTLTTLGFSVDDLTGENLQSNIRTPIDKFGNNVISIISTVGSIISVIVLIVLGIKYMMGSVDEKAEYKKTLLPYFIGACLLFGASTIAGIIYNIAIDL